MKNYISDGRFLNAVCSHPAAPDSGDPVIIGSIPGVAVTDEGDGGNAAAETTVCTEGIFDLSVKGHNGTSNAAITAGALIYYKSTANPVLNLDDSGVAFGYALEAVDSGDTATIKVLVK